MTRQCQRGMVNGKSETLQDSEINIYSASRRLSQPCKRNQDSETAGPVKFDNNNNYSARHIFFEEPFATPSKQ